MAIKNKYSIERQYIDNDHARSGEKIDNVRFLVSHETANNTADADDHQRYFNGIDYSASAHTFIDDQKILEIIPLDEKAWHVQYQKSVDNKLFGDDANDVAIGTELCRTGKFEDAYDRYVWYHAYLCQKFNLNPKKDIVAHSTLDPQRRSDSQSWLEPNGVTWNEFIQDVQTYYDNWNSKEQEKEETSKSSNEGYEGNSIVDYLVSVGQDPSFSNREKLAKAHGISHYQGTAKQNLELLELLRGGHKPKKKPSYMGKRVESHHHGKLRFYNKPSWDDKDVAGHLQCGYGFPTITDKVKVDNGHQYKVKNSKGDVYYVTASKKYVHVE